jgi:hypothetical protein
MPNQILRCLVVIVLLVAHPEPRKTSAAIISQTWSVPTEVHITSPTHSFARYDGSQGPLEHIQLENQSAYRGGLIAVSNASPGNFNGWAYELAGRLTLIVDGVRSESPFNFTEGGVVNGPQTITRTFESGFPLTSQLIDNHLPFLGTGGIPVQLSLTVDRQQFSWSQGGSADFLHRYGVNTTLSYAIISEPMSMIYASIALATLLACATYHNRR